jgi:hypothetical protein
MGHLQWPEYPARVTNLQFALPIDNTLEDVRSGGTSMIDLTSGSGSGARPGGPGWREPRCRPARLSIVLRYTYESHHPSYRMVIASTSCSRDDLVTALLGNRHPVPRPIDCRQGARTNRFLRWLAAR